jgi:hypothetical protein
VSFSPFGRGFSRHRHDYSLSLSMVASPQSPHSCRGFPRRRSEAPCASIGSNALVSFHGNAGHGKWSRFSALAAAIPGTRRHSHRFGRCGWRLGRFFLAFRPRRHKAANRAVLWRSFPFRGLFFCRCFDPAAARHQMARELATGVD